jgi:hypothetical protein
VLRAAPANCSQIVRGASTDEMLMYAVPAVCACVACVCARAAVHVYCCSVMPSYLSVAVHDRWPLGLSAAQCQQQSADCATELHLRALALASASINTSRGERGQTEVSLLLRELSVDEQSQHMKGRHAALMLCKRCCTLYEQFVCCSLQCSL